MSEQKTSEKKSMWVLYRDNEDGQLMICPADRSAVVNRGMSAHSLLELNFYGGFLRFGGDWYVVAEDPERIKLRRLARLVGEERQLPEARSCYVYDVEEKEDV